MIFWFVNERWKILELKIIKKRDLRYLLNIYRINYIIFIKEYEYIRL